MSFQYSRVMIFGRPGSGKSTFALRLIKTTGLPLYHLDKYFYEAKWVERDYQKFLGDQRSLVNQERWIIDGNSTKSLEMRFSNADLVLYFNYPRAICYWRIFKRLFSKTKEINDRAKGCQEIVRWSLLKYMWSFESKVAKQIADLKQKYPNYKFMEITSDKDLNRLEELL